MRRQRGLNLVPVVKNPCLTQIMTVDLVSLSPAKTPQMNFLMMKLLKIHLQLVERKKTLSRTPMLRRTPVNVHLILLIVIAALKKLQTNTCCMILNLSILINKPIL